MKNKGILLIGIFLIIVIIFLSGCAKRVEEKPSPELQEKMQSLQPKIDSWIQAGNDPSQIQPLVRKLEQHINNKRFSQAEPVVDEILSIISETPSQPAEPAPEPIPVQPAEPKPEPIPEPVAEPVPEPELKRENPVLISPNWGSHKGNFDKFPQHLYDAYDLLTDNGMNFFNYQAWWERVEPEPGEIDEGPLLNLLQSMDGKYDLDGYLLVFKPIDTGVRVMPDHLKDLEFDDPQVKESFENIIETLAADPSSNQLTHILVGNEVNAYFTRNPDELDSWLNFYEFAVDLLHEKFPGVKVGTITTHDSVNDKELFEKLTEKSDFIDFTYYPAEGLVLGNVAKNWQFLPIEEIEEPLLEIVSLAGNKQFAFTEIGYASAEKNSGSEELQSEFVEEMFRVLDPYHDSGQLEFLLFSFMYDAPTEAAEAYAARQGQEAEYLVSFMTSYGLRSYETNEPRKAWFTFIEKANTWINEAKS